VVHVQRQFAYYGPLSIDHEYFGFIYRQNGVIDSAVIRSGRCAAGNCVVDAAGALEQVPRGSKVLGEWHTHPHDGSTRLSPEDVRGAYRNRQIRCYVPFYSGSNGKVYSWDPASTSVPVAMASRVALGSYADGWVASTGDDVRPGSAAAVAMNR
jgi:hypothetical protein